MRAYLFQTLFLLFVTAFILHEQVRSNLDRLRYLRSTADNSGLTEKISVDIVALGDVLLLRSLAREVYLSDFAHLISRIKMHWQRSSFVIANLEGVSSSVDKTGKLIFGAKPLNELVYTNGVKAGGFNYHESILKELREGGINMLTTANNHAFDRGFLGINESIDALKAHDFIFHGTSEVPYPPSSTEWIKFTETNGIVIAWISCTNILCPTCRAQFRATLHVTQRHICHCSNVLKIIRNLKDEEKFYDFLIVSPHWGAQFKEEPPKHVQKLAFMLLEEGADIILGNHPHIPQRAFRYHTKDDRMTYCFYSIGSLTSGLGSYEKKKYKQRSSVILKFKLSKTSSSEKRIILNVLPICEIWIDGRRTMVLAETKDIPCKKELALLQRLFTIKNISNI